jgi:hypothetical protein
MGWGVGGQGHEASGGVAGLGEACVAAGCVWGVAAARWQPDVFGSGSKVVEGGGRGAGRGRTGRRGGAWGEGELGEGGGSVRKIGERDGPGEREHCGRVGVRVLVAKDSNPPPPSPFRPHTRLVRLLQSGVPALRGRHDVIGERGVALHATGTVVEAVCVCACTVVVGGWRWVGVVRVNVCVAEVCAEVGPSRAQQPLCPVQSTQPI